MLRLEAGIGKDLYGLVKHAPNIRVLYISTKLRSWHSITGLQKAIPLLDPVTLYIFSWPHRINEVVSKTRLMLLGALSGTWDQLVNSPRSRTLSLSFSGGCSSIYHMLGPFLFIGASQWMLTERTIYIACRL